MGNNTLTLVVVALEVIARVVARITYEQIIHPSVSAQTRFLVALPGSDLRDLSPTVSAGDEEYPHALLRSLSDALSGQAETQAFL